MGKIANILMILFFCILILSSCSTTKFEAYRPSKTEISKVEMYDPNLTHLKKPKFPVIIFLDDTFRPTDENTAKYIAMNNKNFSKIILLNDLFNLQKEMIIDHITLINLKNKQINELIDIIKLKESQIDKYIDLYESSQNDYIQERTSHKINNFVNRLTIIGLIVIIIIA